MTLTFNATEVRRLIRHSIESKEHKSLYDMEGTDTPGLWLVGDHGVYLMSNGDPGLKAEPGNPESKRNVVAYARECNPELDPEGWWDAKRAGFGGDDGVEFLSQHWFRRLLVPGDRSRVFRLYITEKHISTYKKR